MRSKDKNEGNQKEYVVFTHLKTHSQRYIHIYNWNGKKKYTHIYNWNGKKNHTYLYLELETKYRTKKL